MTKHRLHELTHVIDSHLHGMEPTDVVAFLGYLCAGWPNGVYGERPAGIMAEMRCLDCPHTYPNCPGDCATYQFLRGNS